MSKAAPMVIPDILIYVSTETKETCFFANKYRRAIRLEMFMSQNG